MSLGEVVLGGVGYQPVSLLQEVGDSGSLKLTATNGNACLRIALSNDGAGRCVCQPLPSLRQLCFMANAKILHIVPCGFILRSALQQTQQNTAYVPRFQINLSHACSSAFILVITVIKHLVCHVNIISNEMLCHHYKAALSQ